jgi:hypothetical protein
MLIFKSAALEGYIDPVTMAEPKVYCAFSQFELTRYLALDIEIRGFGHQGC